MDWKKEMISDQSAREALDALDDYARMDTGVDAMGPRGVLEKYIAQREADSAELEKQRRVNTDYLHIIHEHQGRLAKYEPVTPSRPLKRRAKGWQQCPKCDVLHVDLPENSAFVRAHREAEHLKNQEGGAK